MALNPGLYLRTIRHLRPTQIAGRIFFRLYHPRVVNRPAPPLCAPTGAWTQPVANRVAMLGPNRLRLLNVEREIFSASDWNHPGWERLWLYNLHYFDDLLAADAATRKQWHEDIMRRWLTEVSPGEGVGWEPYPTSLRIVNWMKWLMAGNGPVEGMLDSLAMQTHWLVKRLERHLMGNHLLANAKALVFAGLFFEGRAATNWLNRGLKILNKELPVQILADGGHYERSPMYHSLVLVDLLDLVNLLTAYEGAREDHDFTRHLEGWRARIQTMRHWLKVMCHPDGEISFFNDAALGMAPSPSALEAYAEELGLPPVPNPQDGITHLAASGYIRLQTKAAVALLDVAPLGPDYLLAHAHADTLSFEMSLGNQRILINSGTSLYGLSRERLEQRGTAAHNTVEVDGENSSEVWGGFRVARRAVPIGLQVADEGENGLVVSCAHSGYERLPGRVIHRRTWRMTQNRLEIEDQLEGKYTSAVNRFHCHPATEVTRKPAEAGLKWQLAPGMVLETKPAATIRPSQYFREFGMAKENQCIEIPVDAGQGTCTLSWK